MADMFWFLFLVHLACALANSQSYRPIHKSIQNPIPEKFDNLTVVFSSIAIRGHAEPLLRIADYMCENGHKVYFAIQETGIHWINSDCIYPISLGVPARSDEQLEPQLHQASKDVSTFHGIITLTHEIYLPNVGPIYEKIFPELIKINPDIVVADISTFGAIFATQKLQFPLVLNNPSTLITNSDAPFNIPAWGSALSSEMSFWDRFINVIYPKFITIALTPSFVHLNRIRWDEGLEIYRSQNDILRGLPILTSNAFGFDYPRHISPLIKMVGSLIPQKNKIPSLSVQTRNWLKTDGQHIYDFRCPRNGLASSMKKNDTILVQLGRMPKTANVHIRAIMEGLDNYHVLWLVPEQQPTYLDFSTNYIQIEELSSVSPLSILSNKAVKLVVSHCGVGVVIDSLSFGKPLLCIPFFGDQYDVTARVVDCGAGLSIQKQELSPDKVRHSVDAILSNASFNSAASALQLLFRSSGGLKASSNFIHTIARAGSLHLKTLDDMLPWHQASGVDVGLFYIALIGSCISIIHMSLKYLIRFTTSFFFIDVNSELQDPPIEVEDTESSEIDLSHAQSEKFHNSETSGDKTMIQDNNGLRFRGHPTF